MKISVNLSPEEIDQIDYLKKITKASSRGQVIRQMLEKMAPLYEDWWTADVHLTSKSTNLQPSSPVDYGVANNVAYDPYDNEREVNNNKSKESGFVPLDKLL